jgi:hypothetical protein
MSLLALASEATVFSRLVTLPWSAVSSLEGGGNICGQWEDGFDEGVVDKEG